MLNSRFIFHLLEDSILNYEVGRLKFKYIKENFLVLLVTCNRRSELKFSPPIVLELFHYIKEIFFLFYYLI